MLGPKKRPYRTELPIESFGTVSLAAPVPDLGRALVALVTESGLVPYGNPDRLETWNASKWFKYPVAKRTSRARGRRFCSRRRSASSEPPPVPWTLGVKVESGR